MATIQGIRDPQLDASADNEGVLTKTYTLTYLVKGELGDTVSSIAGTPGLPRIFAPLSGDSTCLCNSMAVKRAYAPNEKGVYWEVACKYTNRALKRCYEDSFSDAIDNPLLAPPVVSGSFVNYTKETSTGYTANNNPYRIRNSVGEIIEGIERDYNRPQVVISLNVPELPLTILANSLDTLNDAPIWGCSKGAVKFSNFSWTKEYRGTCAYYYKVTLTFDISFVNGYTPKGDPVTGWLRVTPDHGHYFLPEGKPRQAKFLEPAVTANGQQPQDIMLDGHAHKLDGQLSDGEVFEEEDIFYWYDQPYQYSNFNLLGLPETL